MKFLNRNAYIMCAIHGKNFCSSAKDAFNLLMRNVLRVFALDKVSLKNIVTDDNHYYMSYDWFNCAWLIFAYSIEIDFLRVKLGEERNSPHSTLKNTISLRIG